MKGFVFTLDAIFSVVFASMAVSILIYIHYTSYSPAQFQVSQASAALSNIMKSSASGLFNGSKYSKYLEAYSGTSQYSWPEYGQNQELSSSSDYGPKSPLLLNSVSFSGDIIPDIAISGGYGVLGISSNQIYIFNSTTLNGVLYNAGNAVISTPLIYGQSAIFATDNGYVTAVSLSNSPTQLWSQNVGFNAITTPLEVENKYLIFSGTTSASSNQMVYLMTPSNGTIYYADNTGSSNAINTIAYDGTFLLGAKSYNTILAGQTISAAGEYGIGTYSSITPINSIGTANNKFLLYSLSGPNTYSYLGTYYIPITITNGASSPTPTNFQQMIYFDPSLSEYSGYFASDLGNIRFYAGQTELHSWCESGCTSSSTNAVFWVNLGSTTIPAGNTIIINSTLLPTSTEYDGIFAGEAPQLSPIYGEYDNGASVFNNYQNYAGTTLWNQLSYGSNLELTQNNGLEITVNTLYGGSVMTNWYATSPYVFESLITAQNSGGSGNFQEGLISDSQTNSGTNLIGNPLSNAYSTRMDLPDDFYQINIGSTILASTSPSGSYPYSSLESIAQSGSDIESYDNGYSLSNTLANTYSNGYLGYQVLFTLTTGNAISVQYSFTRNYPPNGVMPSFSFGSSPIKTTAPNIGAALKSINLFPLNTSLGGASGNGNYSFAVFSNDIIYTNHISPFNFTYRGNSYNTTPSVSGSIGYMLLGDNNFVGFDAASGSVVFNITLPYRFHNYPFSQVSLANGRAYVPDGNTLYLFGEATMPQNTSALSELASLYISKRGGLADALLESIYNTSGSGIFINGTYAPSLYVSSFSGSPSSYMLVSSGSTSPEANNRAMSMCEWFKINSVAGFNGLIFKGTEFPSSGNVPEYSIGSNALQLGFNITSSSGALVASANAPGQINSNDINHWMFSCMAYNASSSTAIYYLNGTAYYGTASNSLFPSAGSGNMVIGAGPHGSSDVDIANIQLYANNLTVANMGRLYYLGMFGAPLSGNSLIGWWPMLGDTNDYYGDNIGFPYGVSYVQSGYIPRQLFNTYQISDAGSPIPVYSNGAYSIKNVSVVVWS